ncbi:MAG TPA: hypothetical protein VNM92_13760 [Thermoanaerobaculia bacterium]|nr:hypothetical protein [Thermoanaerobaculia bacterium]
MSRLSRQSERVLILGGAGMVGLQVAREAVRELNPSAIIISALTQPEVDDAVATLTAEAAAEGWKIEFRGAAGDIFLPTSLQGKSRAELFGDRALFERLFEEIFDPQPESFQESAFYSLIETHQPDVVVDCINTATAISYQDVYTTSRKVKVLMDRVEQEGSAARKDDLDRLLGAVRELLLAQSVPQITRHILLLHRILQQSSVRVYVKVGTTGTGGMGINIPYTHSEDRPSPTLLSKSAIGFAHTGLLFLLARTPSGVSGQDHGPVVKEIKPGAMIGFKRLGVSHVKITGATGKREPGYLISPRTDELGTSLAPVQDPGSFRQFEERAFPVRIIGADTGENGFFAIGEFQAITYPRQMEYVTPEEVARTVILEILGAATGRDVLSAIDGAITEPSYRAGVLRDHATREMQRLERLIQAEDGDVLPSIALGHLGPPRLSKLLIEAFLLRSAAGSASFEELLSVSPEEMRVKVEHFLEANPRIESLIVTIGIPILRERESGMTLTRGPRLNIPVQRPDAEPVELDAQAIERYGFMGWVDLRERNFEGWRDRIRIIAKSQPDIAQWGSAAFDHTQYVGSEFVPGDVVGWLLTNESDETGIAGRRMF